MIILFILLSASCNTAVKLSSSGTTAPKPLYRDSVYDGAAAPVVIWMEILDVTGIKPVYIDLANKD